MVKLRISEKCQEDNLIEHTQTDIIRTEIRTLRVHKRNCDGTRPNQKTKGRGRNSKDEVERKER